jgi:cytosine/creatinine deaminase
MIPASHHYWLRNAHVPEALMVLRKQGRSKEWLNAANPAPQDELLFVDIEIAAGEIASIAMAGSFRDEQHPSVDLRGGLVFPCFVDLHTHLDKGHLWERSPNPDGSFPGAMQAAAHDAQQYFTPDDIYQRMEFGLQCSYAHGTQAIRTHIDSGGNLAQISLDVFQQLREKWRDRLILQAASLTSLETYTQPQGEAIADQIAALNTQDEPHSVGILGGVAFMNPNIEAQIDRVFALAKERHLHLDFHTDETDDPQSISLRLIAEAALRHHFSGQIVCGHCCSLATQPEAEAKKTIKLVKQAKIGIVSLPLCNLYLQDRKPQRTPRWRGVTLLHELKQAGVPVALASDNCRDPFHAFGDHDALEVFSLSTKIAHLDRPYGNWCRTITTTPADLMGLSTIARIGVGLSADLVIFRARRYSELLSRSQHDRIILRRGLAIDTTLPDYAQLDPLIAPGTAF